MSIKKTVLPKILVTMGEPAGIGPELLVRISQFDLNVELIVLADPQLLLTVAEKLEIPLGVTLINCKKSESAHADLNCDTEKKHRRNHLYVDPIELPHSVVPGRLDKRNAQATLNMLSRASELALSGKVDAIVTAPVHKANLNQIDRQFLGHTEFFAKAANVDQVVMMLATNEMRVTLATTHLPLTQVSFAVTEKLLENILNTILKSFKQFGLSQSRVAVCGLNPHAGEDGLLGHEDAEIIAPVIKRLQQQGKSVYGPFPADTLFTPQKRQAYDVFLAMYHDQGLPVIKAFGFGQCVNVTLGLPYIRTSVDHGTALDIATSYSASCDSLKYAIDYAVQLTQGKLPG